MKEEYICPYTGAYCEGLEENDNVCVNCSIGIDNMVGQEF